MDYIYGPNVFGLEFVFSEFFLKGKLDPTLTWSFGEFSSMYFCKYVVDFIIALAFFKISRVSYFTTHMYEKKLLGESFSWVELYISYYNFWTEIHFNDVFFAYK